MKHKKEQGVDTTSETTGEKYYSVKTLAEELGVSRGCVNSWIRDGLLVGTFRLGTGAWIIRNDWKLYAYHPNPKVNERLIPRSA